ncbi:hypothetical protein OPS25_01370 [Alteromonas ponticola]|uniref:Flagellar motor switch protein FliN-like C-terminal domain-containing protein n=1 Tax=Alteromonas aquimaris TaxID=2998417 RepID=A0ABT3P309_9ALTE|nr:hypothetical protein [Alteromonas aquimaris]MCW8107152.1 hypothetical protein [Alteromonas aquimaris]
MKKKLLCLNVELLNAYNNAKPTYPFMLPSPKLCSAFVTVDLIDTINKALSLIDENDLNEVSFRSDDVNWFSSLSERIYQEIRSNLHVTKDCIYFSGAFAPDKTPVFVSTRLPLSSITPDEKRAAKQLNLAFLATDTAKALISEIENLDREMQLAWERLDSLEGLTSAIDGVKAASFTTPSAKTDELALEVSIEIKQLEKEAESLEQLIERKCELLCSRVLSISVGDRIITQTKLNNKNQEIQLESVRYYNGTLYLTGPKVLKNGSLGKRSESAYVTLVPDDEHK